MTYNGVKSHKKAGLRPLSLKNKFFNKRLRKESNLFPGLFRVKFSIYTAVWNMHSVNTNFKYISFFLYSQIKILSVTNCVHQCNSHSRIFKHVFFLYVNCFFLCLTSYWRRIYLNRGLSRPTLLDFPIYF